MFCLFHISNMIINNEFLSKLLTIELRDVKESDWDLILKLRNDFFNFFYKQKKPILKDEHYLYLQEQKSNPNFYHWMIILNDDVVGYVKIKDSDIGIMIKKEYQNQGFGTMGLKLAEQKARDLGISKLIALIQEENITSQKSFQKNGYKLKMLWYE